MEPTSYLRVLFILMASFLLLLSIRTWIRLPSLGSVKVELDCSEFGSWCTFKNRIQSKSSGGFIQRTKPKRQQKADHENEVAKHPLDPLTLREIKRVQSIMQKTSIFNHRKFALHSVVLEEPLKEEVLSWKAGSSLPTRKASIIAWADGHAHKLIVDLALGQIVENQISHENGYPIMTMEDMASALQVSLESK
jgi:primary-amine oxidase